MMKLKRLSSLFLSALMLTSMLAGSVQAALLDVGPNVPRVIGSTPQSPGGLGHGFPLWYRDTNRVPLELCTDEAMCLFLRPNTNQPVTFPNNMPDEVFFYSADATMNVPGGTADLITAIEGVIAVDNGNVTLTSFARVRIRVDTAQAGTYIVTTPFKQYTFENVPVDDRGINFTEDIGIGEDGVFTGALNGSIGPFVYSQGAPFVTATGSYIGTNNPLPVLGSTFIPPGQSQPANYFRVQGPGVDVSTNLFAVTGKIYETITPTPLTVDKVTYARDASGVQVSAFATTQALSNNVDTQLPFPQNFALTNVPSSLQLTGAGLPSPVLSTNNPGDGKFFTNTGVFALQNIPANATITNTADTPATVKTVPLVDEVKITSATFNPINSTLTVSAESLDTLGNRTLSVYFPGNGTPLGTISGGQFSATAPFIAGALTYAIPPVSIIVKSDIGGEATVPVIAYIQEVPSAATFLAVSANLVSPQQPGAQVSFTSGASGGSGPYEYAFWLRDTSGTYSLKQAYSLSSVWNWDTTGLPAGVYAIAVHTRNVGSTGGFDQEKVVPFVLNAAAPATSQIVFSSLTSPQSAGSLVTIAASATGGSGPYEYAFWLKDTTGVYSLKQAYSASPLWNWDTAGLPAGNYTIAVHGRVPGTTNGFNVETIAPFVIQ